MPRPINPQELLDASPSAAIQALAIAVCEIQGELFSLRAEVSGLSLRRSIHNDVIQGDLLSLRAEVGDLRRSIHGEVYQRAAKPTLKERVLRRKRNGT
jgi:hypothetical protein